VCALQLNRIKNRWIRPVRYTTRGCVVHFWYFCPLGGCARTARSTSHSTTSHLETDTCSEECGPVRALDSWRKWRNPQSAGLPQMIPLRSLVLTADGEYPSLLGRGRRVVNLGLPPRPQFDACHEAAVVVAKKVRRPHLLGRSAQPLSGTASATVPCRPDRPTWECRSGPAQRFERIRGR